MKKRLLHKQNILSGFGFIVRFALGCMFLISALPKIRQPYDFLGDVYGYELVGPKLGMLIAMTMPWAELIVGICLLGSIFVGGALLISAGMAAVFTFALSSALYRGLEISCGCFSASGGGIISYSTLIRACVILLFSIAAYISIVIMRPCVVVRESNKATSPIAEL